MKSRVLKVSVLFGSGPANPAYRELLSSLDNLQILQEGLDPETFAAQQQEKPPDLVLVDLDGMSTIPDWLESLIGQLPKSEVMVCSHSRDPDFLIRVMKLRAGGFIPLPLNREELLGHLERVRLGKERPAETGLGQILAVIGTKGGVGTTSVATNLAVALAGWGAGEVILVDLARPFPHVGQFLDLKSAHTIQDLADSAEKLDSTFVHKVVQKHKSNLEVLLGYPNYNLESRAFPDSQSLEKILQTLRNSYQWIVIDLGAWLDLLWVRMLKQADHILLLTQLSVPDLQNLKQIKALLRNSDIDESKWKIVVNHYAKDYSLGLKDVENICNQPAVYTLPHDYRPLIEAINQGMPLGELAPRSKLWRSLKGLAAEFVAERKSQTEKQVATKPGLFQRLFR